MAISVIGTPASAAATTVTPATHAIGDYIVIVAFRSATTAPTLPAGYTSIVTGSGNSNSYRVGYKIATSTTDASGTWTNASALLCTVYRGVSGIGASIAATKAAATTATIGTITIANQNSKSWVVAFAGHAATSTQGTPLAGATTSRVTQTAGTYNGGMFDTNAGVNTFSATTSSNTTSVVSCGGAFELMSTDSFSTFSDAMTGSTQDTTKWGGNFGTLSWSPSGFTISQTSAYTGYGGETTLQYYDLTGTAFYCNMPTAASQLLTSSETSPFQLLINATNYLGIYINGGNIQAHYQVAGVDTFLGSTAYVPLTMTWFRITESAGTIGWDYSANGSSWTSIATHANPIVVTALQAQPVMGTFNSEVTGTSAVWNSFNTTGSVSASITQVAATVTATGGTQSIATTASSSITQLAATVTATGGTQSVASAQKSAIAQVAATVTATGGTQAIATVQNASVAQLAATITATGGVQAVAAIAVISASIIQVGATVTATGGTQTVRIGATVVQVAATITATGGTQAVATVNIVSIAQVHATLTATGGTQVASTAQTASVTQLAATVTATGGTQAIASAQKSAIAQVHATLTATGGTQVIVSAQNVAIAQVHAVLTATGGTQTVVALTSVAIAQIGATLIARGGIQLAYSPPKFTPISVIISDAVAASSISDELMFASVGSTSTIEAVSDALAAAGVSTLVASATINTNNTKIDM